jgi:hypothetical protein
MPVVSSFPEMRRLNHNSGSNPWKAFRTNINKSLVKSGFDHHCEFLPEGKISKLVTKDAVGSLLPGAEPPLVEFVCEHARKVFLIASWVCDTSDDLVSIMNDFQEFDMTDKRLPIDDIVGDGTCNAEKCTHDKALLAFHSKHWETHTISRFYKEQWIFCPPMFKKSDLQKELKEKCVLPLTWVNEHNLKQGHFSTVFEAKLHADHYEHNSDSTGVRQQAWINTYVLMKTTGSSTRDTRRPQETQPAGIGI